MLIERLRPANGMTFLDLGGWDGRLLNQICQTANIGEGRFIVADVDPHVETARMTYGFEPVILRPGSPLPFEDGEIDVLWCNSVIEHITPNDPRGRRIPGTITDKQWEADSHKLQAAFAAEIRRISKSYFVQTPHRMFPIEVHTGIPAANFFSHDSTIKLVGALKGVWPRPIGYVDWCLLVPQEMQEIFPEAKIEVEKFLGIPKSVIAWKRT